MTIAQLEAALAASDGNKRAYAVAEFGRGEFGVEALPVLRRALADRYVSTVINAAECIGKLGPAALNAPAADEELPTGIQDEREDLVGQLRLAGGRTWSYSGYANCYSTCLEALLSIGADPEYVVDYVKAHIGLAAPHDLIASLKALAAIGTPEALDLFDRAVAFWRPDMNKGTAKKVDALAARMKRAPIPKTKTRSKASAR